MFSDIPLLVLNKLVIDSYLSSSHTLPLRTTVSGFSRRQLFVGCITTEPLVVPSRLIIYLKEPLATLTTADISFIPDTPLTEVLIQIQYPASFTFVVTPQPSYKMPSLGSNVYSLNVRSKNNNVIHPLQLIIKVLARTRFVLMIYYLI